MENPVDGTDGKLGRGFMSADKLEEVDIGSGDKPRPTFISANMQPDFREGLIKLLKEYKDCFAWDYSEMPGLDRSIVEHRLPIKSGFKPYKQPPWKIYKDGVLADVKKEIERLLDANFVRPCRYAEWISNIVPVYKKNRKKRNRRSLPPARVGTAPFCLIGGATAVEAAHHVDWGCALFEEELRLAKIRELQGLVES
jgi:hypothetical protein